MLFDSNIGRARGVLWTGVVPKSSWVNLPGNPFDRYLFLVFPYTLPEAPFAMCAFQTPLTVTGSGAFSGKGAQPSYSSRQASLGNVWQMSWFCDTNAVWLFLYGNATLSAQLASDTAPENVSYVIFQK
jgi:hypothetical protein